MLQKDLLHPYQNRAIDFIKEKKRCFLMLDMGLGKTVSTLTAISDLLQEGKISKALIIAPLRVSNTVWAQEATYWEHLTPLTFSIATGNDKARFNAFNKDAQIYITNRENVPWLMTLLEDNGIEFPFDCVVIDESSSFKSYKSQRFKALKKVINIPEYVIALSATPAPNGFLDLWPQMFLVDSGKSLGKSYFFFRKTFFTPDHYGYNWEIKPNAPEYISKKISNICLTMRSADYIKLPDRLDLIQYITLPKKVLLEYKAFEKSLLATLPDGEELTASNEAILANKLLQYASGFLYDNDKVAHSLHDYKINALAEYMDTITENVILAYNYKHELELFKKTFKYAKILTKDDQLVQEWNEGKIKLLLAHPASCGHGLNLQKGGNVIVWYGLPWSLELYHQLNGRLHRQGQDKPVRIVHFIVKETYDEKVKDRLALRNHMQEYLLKGLTKGKM